MKKNRRFLPILGAAAALAVSNAHAALDTAPITTGITEASTAVTAVGAAALGLAVIFMGIKLLKRGVRSV